MDSHTWIIGQETFPEPGALQEMLAVLELHERHGIVVPRSNGPGYWRVPVNGQPLAAGESLAIWRCIHDNLPRYQLAPSGGGSCVLIRRQVVEHFGLPNSEQEIPAYSEHINRYGYSTVIANRSFVRVQDDITSETPPGLKEYLEFDLDPVDYFASLAAPHTPRVLYDLTHLAPRYNGTADLALNLLRDLRWLARSELDIFIDIQPAALDFFQPELSGYPRHEQDQLYDLAFKPSQINSWGELERISRLAPRIAYTVLDMIAVRCQYLAAPGKALLFRQCAQMADRVFTLSHSVKTDFAALTGSDVHLEAVHLATNYGVSTAERSLAKYVLLMGNSYAHKGIGEALQALKDAEFPIVVIGGGEPSGSAESRVRYLESGSLSRAIVRETVAGARILVYPSHYEGFGLPVLDALALGKAVILLDNETNRELVEFTHDPNLHVIPSMRVLLETAGRLWSAPSKSPTIPQRWYTAARHYLNCFQDMLGREIDFGRLRMRWDFLRARGL